MAITFPTTIDDFTNPISSNTLNSPSHSEQHQNINDAVEALEAKVGVNGSAVTTSHDYKIAQLETNTHVPVTVTDSAEIDFTLTGQDITASLKSASIDETKLDTSVNASLDLADSALQDIVSDTTPQLGGQLDVNGNALGDGTLELLKFSETASAVNEITVKNAATGNAPELQATGDDANIDLNLVPKGTGGVKVGGVEIPSISSTSTLTNKTLEDAKFTTSINAQTGTTYTLVLTDNSKLITLTNDAAITLTIPTNSSVAFPIGTQIDLIQMGVGKVTFAGAGVTINSKGGNKAIADKFVGVSLIKTDTDTWLLVGDLIA